MDYWSQTEHLGLDDDGWLWLRMPPEADDLRLGWIGRAEVPPVAGVDPARLEDEREWLEQEWMDAPDPAELRAEAMATYYGGLGR